MFQRFGEFLSRWWIGVACFWVAVAVTLFLTAPSFDSVVTTGEFAFLPKDMPSRQAEELFAEAFPKDTQRSSIVIVIRRSRDNRELSDQDLQFIDNGGDVPETGEKPYELKAQLLKIAEKYGGVDILDTADEPTSSDKKDDAAPVAAEAAGKAPPAKITAIKTYRDSQIGRLLQSKDKHAALVMVDLTKDFMDAANKPIVRDVQNLLESDEFKRKSPPGLDITLSGSATVGRDMLDAANESAKSTEMLTVVLVVILLIAIYRAPVLALIPLMTVFLSVEISLTMLRILAKAHLVTLFQEIRPYVTVLVYGAGVDYCLFLIARYKEELDSGVNYQDAISNALGKVGAAITASAGTVICGIAMMTFATFAKFHEAGIAISLGLVIVLLASLTFTPAMLRATGRWAFWPQMRSERPSGGWLPVASSINAFTQAIGLKNLWGQLSEYVLRKPGTVWITTTMLMIPWAIVGVIFYTHLSYGLLSDLPNTSPSVQGTNAVQEHFPAGAAGPVTILVKNPKIDFSQRTTLEGEPGGLDLIGELTAKLNEDKDALQLDDVRSVASPFGNGEMLDAISNLARRKITTVRSIDYYVSQAGQWENHVTRLDLTTQLDPFSRDSMRHLDELRKAIRERLPEGLRKDTSVYISGSTASIRDLKTVTDGDQVKIDLLVVGGVFLILVALLRQPAICLYLVLTVLFSYLVTLGVTYVFFWGTDPGFSGLDWKVPMFLFTILIAVGEDYNIFLMTRIEEEQHTFGPVDGVIHALSKTGKIISSCGIIMAGTFASLMAGSLRGMSQLGFALAFGVLLDTFVIRTILVPAYLVLLHGGKLGRIGDFLGARQISTSPLAAESHLPPTPLEEGQEAITPELDGVPTTRV